MHTKYRSITIYLIQSWTQTHTIHRIGADWFGVASIMETMEYEAARNLTLLFFLERLMERGEPRTLHDLSCQFGSKGFTKEMRQIAGGSQSGEYNILNSCTLLVLSVWFNIDFCLNGTEAYCNIVLGVRNSTSINANGYRVDMVRANWKWQMISRSAVRKKRGFETNVTQRISKMPYDYHQQQE